MDAAAAAPHRGAVLLSRVAKKVAADERSSPTAPLSNNSGDGLRDFLNGPLWHQLRVVEGHEDPVELVFVFGHTHKPFCDTLRYAGYGAPVARYNTGGWVVDSLRPLPGHGGAVLLFDEELRAANVEVFRRHGSANVVSVHSASSEHEVFGAQVPGRDRVRRAEVVVAVQLDRPRDAAPLPLAPSDDRGRPGARGRALRVYPATA